MVDANTREATVTETEPVVIAAAIVIVIVVIVTAVNAAVSVARPAVTVVAVSVARPAVTVAAVSVAIAVRTAVASAAVAVGAAAIVHAAVAAVSKIPVATERLAREPPEGVTIKEIVTKVRDAASAGTPIAAIAVIAAEIARTPNARMANAQTEIVRVKSLPSAIRTVCRMTLAIE